MGCISYWRKALSRHQKSFSKCESRSGTGAVFGGWVAEKSGQGGKSGPDVVLRFWLLVVYSYLQVSSPARVATWRAFEAPWGILCILTRLA
jgi:hypothetical protein